MIVIEILAEDKEVARELINQYPDVQAYRDVNFKESQRCFNWL